MSTSNKGVKEIVKSVKGTNDKSSVLSDGIRNGKVFDGNSTISLNDILLIREVKNKDI